MSAALTALDELDPTTASALPFEHAWTLLVKGRLHRRAKQKRAAADALTEALDCFERLGAPAFAAHVHAPISNASGCGARQPN